jgi:hypothetical protein
MVYRKIRSSGRAQIYLGLIYGLVFGFLLQKGGLAEYDVIIGQLLLTDFTVVRVMLSAILVGMAGVFIMRWAGIIRLQTKPGSIGSTVLGGGHLRGGVCHSGLLSGHRCGCIRIRGHGRIDGDDWHRHWRRRLRSPLPFPGPADSALGCISCRYYSRAGGTQAGNCGSIGGHADHGAAAHDSGSGSMIRLELGRNIYIPKHHH